MVATAGARPHNGQCQCRPVPVFRIAPPSHARKTLHLFALRNSRPFRSRSKSIFRLACLPKTIVVGLAEGAVKESIHRIERALVNSSGYHRPVDRIVINLSPAELPKDAASFDLPIALGLIVASGQLQSERFDTYAAVGELALEGTVRHVKGALAMAIAAREKQGKKGLLVPVANAQEAAVVEGIEIIAVGSLAEAVGFFSGELEIEPTPFSWREVQEKFAGYEIDYSDRQRPGIWPSGPSPSRPRAGITC